MIEQHPITPPLELTQRWFLEAKAMPVDQWVIDVATQAARWGADQELEAVIAWMMKMGYWGEDGKAIPALREARRPKPPSLKAQALEALKHAEEGWRPVPADCEIIRRALEFLPD